MAVEGREIVAGPPLEAEVVDRQKELKAHEFRFKKRVNSPSQVAVFQVIRADEAIWERVEPSPDQQRKLESATALPGETQRISTAMIANTYRNPEGAVLLDVANLEATQAESEYIKEQIRKGNRYATAVIDGGGVYGTIASAAWLKANPENPLIGFEGSARRGGIWTTSGDVTLDRAWWRMNSRNRPEKRKRRKKGQPAFIAPGTDDNLNSLGADIQNLQVPDITGDQFPTNNQLGRVLEHDNYISGNLAVNSELVKIRINGDSSQRGKFQREYQDKVTGERFFVYSDVGIQATGLGKEDLGFSPLFSSTRDALAEVAQDLAAGLSTPRVVSFFQLVEATTSNRRGMEGEFKRFGLLGKGDTSKVIREFFSGIGGIDPGEPAQTGFFESIEVFGLEKKTAEGLAATERPRYLLNLLDVERDRGGFFRVKPVEGRVVGIGIPKGGKEVIVYLERTIQTPEGPIKRIERNFIPRLITAAGFEDQSGKIYSGLTAETIKDQAGVFQKLDEAVTKPGSTIYFKPESEVSTRLGFVRVDIDMVSLRENMVEVVGIDKNGFTQRRVIDRNNPMEDDSLLLSASQIDKLEIAGEPPKFEPVIDPDYDPEIPIAEKAQGFNLYKIGACTSYPLTQREKD